MFLIETKEHVDTKPYAFELQDKSYFNISSVGPALEKTIHITVTS